MIRAHFLLSPNFMIEFMSQEEVEWCELNKVRITTPGQSDYPQFFSSCTYRPHFLTYWGQPIWNEKSMISIVGSRNPSRQALDWMEQELTLFLDRFDMPVVSGGARGVDQRAHQIALRMGRGTVVFVPAGLMKLYPDSLKEWVPAIIENGGAVISQFAPKMSMQKGFFHARNRLIAAISPVTLAVEARRQSGTLLTSKHVLDIGHALGVVPSFPNEAGLGGLDLIVDGGAQIIRDADDLSVFAGAAKLVNSKAQKDDVGHPRADRRWHFSRPN